MGVIYRATDGNTFFLACMLGFIPVAASLAQQPVAGNTKELKVAKGKDLHFAVASAVDPATARISDKIDLRLIHPLVVDNVELLPPGEQLTVTGTEVRKANPRCNSGEVKLKIDQVAFHDGTSVKVKVVFKGNRPGDDLKIWPKKPSTAGDVAGAVAENIMLDPILTPLLLEIGAKKAVNSTFHRNACSKFTKDHPMPAGAVIVVQTKREHIVRY